ncbi:STAS domain-containing protein [Peijinzhouia sedimentorum]
MKFSINKQDNYTIFSINEEKLDTTISPNVKSELITQNAEGVSNMILDLSQVKYIDSSGLSALLRGNMIYNDNGGIFILAAPSEHVVKLLKISLLDKVLNILPTIEEAIDAVFLHVIESDLEEGEDE